MVGSATTKNCEDYASFDKDNCPKNYHIVKIISTTNSSDHPANVPYTFGSVYEVAKNQVSIPSQNSSLSPSNTNGNTNTNKTNNTNSSNINTNKQNNTNSSNTSTNKTNNTNSSNTNLPSASALKNLKSIYNLTLHNAGTNKEESYASKVVSYQGKLYIVDNNNGVYKLSNNDKYDIVDNILFQNGSMITSDGDISTAPYTTDDFGKIKPDNKNEIYLGYGNNYKVIGNHVIPTGEEVLISKGHNGTTQISVWSGADPSGRISDDGKGHIELMALDGSKIVPGENTTYNIAANGDVTLITNGKAVTLTHNLFDVHGSDNTNSKPSNNTNTTNSVNNDNKHTSESNINSNAPDSTDDNKNNSNVNNTNKGNSSETTNSNNINSSTNTSINKDNSSNITNNNKDNLNNVNNFNDKDNSSKINSNNAQAGNVNANKFSAANKDEINNKEKSVINDKNISNKLLSSNENSTNHTGINVNSRIEQQRNNNEEINNLSSMKNKSLSNSNSQIDSSSNSNDLPQTGDTKDEIIIGSLLALGLLGTIKLNKNN